MTPAAVPPVLTDAEPLTDEELARETSERRRARLGPEADDALRREAAKWGVDLADPPWPPPAPDPPQEMLLSALAECWRQNPDLRFGQLVGLAADVHVDKVAARNPEVAATITAACVDDGDLLEGVRTLLNRRRPAETSPPSPAGNRRAA